MDRRRESVGAHHPERSTFLKALLGLVLILGATASDLGRPAMAEESEARSSEASAAERRDLQRRLAELEAQLTALEAAVERLRAALGLPGAEPEAPSAIRDLEKRIEALSLEIERLRIGEAAAPRAEESIHGFGPAASKIYKADRGVSIGGYGEMLYQNFDSEADDGSASSATDRADFLRAVLYFGYKFDDRFLFNSEIEFEHAETGEGQEGEVAVEFAYLDFKATPSFGVRGGLVLIPMGFLNELHEPPIFHGAQRPDVERFIIPSTWRENGIGVYGDAGPVSYRTYVVASLDASGFSESSGIRGGRQSGSKATADDVALTARVDYAPVPGLLVGASGFTGKTAQGDPAKGDARLSLWDAHAEWNWRGLHLRGLYARAILSDAAAVSVANTDPVTLIIPDIGERMQGWYGEIAWNVLGPLRGTEQELSPFVRYEDLNTQERVAPGFSSSPANDRRVRVYGLTYRPITNVAVKVDFENRQNADGSAVDQFNFALGYLF